VFVVVVVDDEDNDDEVGFAVGINSSSD